MCIYTRGPVCLCCPYTCGVTDVLQLLWLLKFRSTCVVNAINSFDGSSHDWVAQVTTSLSFHHDCCSLIVFLQLAAQPFRALLACLGWTIYKKRSERLMIAAVCPQRRFLSIVSRALDTSWRSISADNMKIASVFSKSRCTCFAGTSVALHGMHESLNCARRKAYGQS